MKIRNVSPATAALFLLYLCQNALIESLRRRTRNKLGMVIYLYVILGSSLAYAKSVKRFDIITKIEVMMNIPINIG